MGNRSSGGYNGEYAEGKRNGLGTCRFQDGSVYDGTWVDDRMEGFGRYLLTILSDRGSYVRLDGTTYEGGWEANMQSGFGKLELPDGDVYEGDFRLGKMDGFGVYRYHKGSIYEGFSILAHPHTRREFRDDEAHGIGLYHGENNDDYAGEWRFDKMDGLGLYRFSSGAFFQGEWKLGKMDGCGIYVNALSALMCMKRLIGQTGAHLGGTRGNSLRGAWTALGSISGRKGTSI